MKRYRVLSIDFDSLAQTLGMEIPEEWEDEVKKVHLKNKKKAEEWFVNDYGESFFEEKKENLLALGDKPFTVIAFHNKFFTQVRMAFIMGAYYPALTGACALGERVLNHLIINLRENFKGTDEYKKVYRKESFDDWNLAIDTLNNWGILLPEVVAEYKKLVLKRNAAIHFRPDVDTNDRELALDAIKSIRFIIRNQFSGLGLQPWFITSIPGEIYIKKEWENHPFIKEVYIKNCRQLGPKHVVKSVNPWVIEDYTYPDKEITDEEFAEARNNK